MGRAGQGAIMHHWHWGGEVRPQTGTDDLQAEGLADGDLATLGARLLISLKVGMALPCLANIGLGNIKTI